jgi:hypothetical protein
MATSAAIAGAWSARRRCWSWSESRRRKDVAWYISLATVQNAIIT